jgi:Cyclic-phosphate processing Receiver domain
VTRSLLIDDLRVLKPADGEVLTTCRSFDDGIDALRRYTWDCLYLDHDLADPDPRKTGYDVLCWLEEYPRYLPTTICLVTQNPVGRQKMQALLDRFKEQHGTKQWHNFTIEPYEEAEEKAQKD